MITIYHIDDFIIADNDRCIIKLFFACEIIADFVQILSY